MITTEFKVLRRKWTTYSRQCPRGSGYCADSGEYQLLMKYWKWRGHTLWKRIVDREEVPSHVWISMAVYGYYTGEWKSKFAKYM